MPRRIFSEAMPACSERMRVASCSADISSEKKPTTAPSWLGSSGGRSGRSRQRAQARARHVEGDVGGERRLAHRRAAGEDDQVGRLQPAHLVVEADELGGDAGQVAVALVGVAGHVDGVGQRRVEAEEALAVLVGLGEREQARLGLLDLLLGREVDGRIVGDVDHVLADQDQLAAGGEVVDGAAVVAGVDDGGGVGGEPAEVLRHRQAGVDRLGVLEEGPERDRRRLLARGDQLGGRLVDLLVQRIVEVLRLQEARHAVVRLVVDEDGAEQRLLGLDVVGRGAEGQRVGRSGGVRRGRGGLASERLRSCAARLSRFRPLQAASACRHGVRSHPRMHTRRTNSLGRLPNRRACSQLLAGHQRALRRCASRSSRRCSSVYM